MQGGEWQGPVVGVVRDFHDESFKSAISPAIFTTSLDNYYEYAVKINMAEAKHNPVGTGKNMDRHVSGSTL